MRLEWINNKVMTAAAVLSFSCVAAAAYTAVQETEVSSDLSHSEPEQYGFVYSLLDAEESLYETSVLQTQQAKSQLNQFYQQAESSLTAPVSHEEVDLRDFALNADRLIQKIFPIGREALSVTDALVQQQGTQTLNTWLLLSVARKFGVEASLSPQQDHAHVVLKNKANSWVEWKVNHLHDMQDTAMSVLDGYDLWTEVDLTLVKHYLAAGMQNNDDSIEALVKAAVRDARGSGARELQDKFLVARGRVSELAFLKH